jgi:hypothetical protein
VRQVAAGVDDACDPRVSGRALGVRQHAQSLAPRGVTDWDRVQPHHQGVRAHHDGAVTGRSAAVNGIASRQDLVLSASELHPGVPMAGMDSDCGAERSGTE